MQNRSRARARWAAGVELCGACLLAMHLPIAGSLVHGHEVYRGTIPAARLAASRQGDTVSSSNAFKIIVVTVECLSLIMEWTSAQLAQWTGTLVRTALVKSRPPNDNDNMTAVL